MAARVSCGRRGQSSISLARSGSTGTFWPFSVPDSVPVCAEIVVFDSTKAVCSSPAPPIHLLTAPGSVAPRRARRSGFGGLGTFRKRRRLAGVHVEQSLVRVLGRVHQLRVGTVRDIHESNVVVLAVHTPQDRLVTPSEPVRTHETGQRRRLLHVVTISLGPLALHCGL